MSCCCVYVNAIESLYFETGEQGKVEESMREMAAIEALKSEKADKEVRLIFILVLRRMLRYCIATV